MDLNLNSIGSLSGALDRLENGKSAYELARRLGLVTPNFTHLEDGRRPFLSGRRFSELTPDQLSDEHAYWRSEMGRLTELVGLLHGQKQLMKVEMKKVLATSRSRVRRELAEQEGERRIPRTEVNDLAAESPEVLETEEKFGYLEMLIAQAEASKEATLSYLEGISREITSRGDQLKARIIG